MAGRSAKRETAPTCPKCGGAMQAGNILDRGPYSIALRAQWAKGGTTFSMSKGLTTSHGLRTVVTWRCTGCGFLESYAS